MLQRLSELRKQRKWSMQEIADQLGIAKSTYAGYESGYREPSLQSLSQLADLFETTVDNLLGRNTNLKEQQKSVELMELITMTNKTIALDGELLSQEELFDFVAFVRTKRTLMTTKLYPEKRN
jgi:transcriptional regulator with XRE-family HTH domain